MSKKRAEEITRRRNTLIQTASDLDISHINHLEVVAEDALLALDDEEVCNVCIDYDMICLNMPL